MLVVCVAPSSQLMISSFGRPVVKTIQLWWVTTQAWQARSASCSNRDQVYCHSLENFTRPL